MIYSNITLNESYIDGQVNNCHKFKIAIFEDSVLKEIMEYTNPKHVLGFINENKAKQVFVNEERCTKSKLVQTLESL